MQKISGGLENVPGYKFNAIECGIKYQNRLDYALIFTETPSVAAGVFTTNKVNAAPVKISKSRITENIQAILINSTNANACTGQEGYNTTLTLTKDIAEHLGIPENSVLMASTGIIGHQLPKDKMLEGNKKLVASLSQKKGSLIQKAIMTTDTFPKSVAATFSTSRGNFTIAGVAKGSGMIAPNMATLLSFLITDAPIKSEDLNQIFKNRIKTSYNAITIDGDMSTNDTAIILSPSNPSPLEANKDLEEFSLAVKFILDELATMLVEDGEGATHAVTINVAGAKNSSDAEKIARAVGESLLVKTAIFGKDPNWGRIAAAIGYSGADIKEELISISIEDIELLKNGTPQNFDNSKAEKVLNQKKYSIYINVFMGDGNFSVMTSDISYDYVKINAEYST